MHKNTSDKMLDLANTDIDDLYWATDPTSPSPKWKQTQIDEESLNDLVSTIKTAASQKRKILSLPYNHFHVPARATKNNTTAMAMMSTDPHMATYHTSAIYQSMKQVSQVKMENKQFLDCLIVWSWRWRPLQ